MIREDSMNSPTFEKSFVVKTLHRNVASRLSTTRFDKYRIDFLESKSDEL